MKLPNLIGKSSCRTSFFNLPNLKNKSWRLQIIAPMLFVFSLYLTGCSLFSSEYGDATSTVNFVGNVDGVEIKNLKSAKYNDYLNVSADLFNNSSKLEQVYYRCKFYDGNNFITNPDVKWEPIQISRKQEQNIHCISASNMAIDFKLELSEKGLYSEKDYK